MARLFTLAEANALLPQLIVILENLRLRKRDLDAKQASLSALHRRAGGNGHGLDETDLATREAQVEQMLAELNNEIERINELGCELKDVDTGLVDFFSLREGRQVYLCWKLGEPEVAFWHELDAGFAGRRPL